MKKFFTLIFFLALSSRILFAFSGLGSGTSGDPYQVTNAAQLAEVRNGLTAYYKQMNDIDLTGVTWTPIGNSSTKFTGSYEGNNKKITGLTVNTSTQGSGLFGYISGGTVQNLGIENASITSTGNGTGIFVGYVQNSSTIKNCYSTGNCNGAFIAGGLIGVTQASTVQCCYSTANVSSASSGTYSYAGGFIGSIETTSTIENCYSTGNASGNLIGIGGFAGRTTTTGPPSIKYCYSTSIVSISSGTSLGGFIGYYNTGTITDCFWNSNLNSSLTSSGYGTPTGINSKTTAAMKSSSTYTNWDFVGETTNGSNDYWNIGTGYPYLNWSTAPGAPTIGTATASDRQASVTFTAPSSNGGNAITGYTVTSNPGGLTGTGTSSPITVSGLTNGTAYTFTVTATNGIGTGAASTPSNAVTPSFTTGIDDANLDGVTIYPNPVDDRLYIKGVDEGEIAVYDMGGCKVISAIIANTQAVNVSGLAKGVYTVRITTPNGRVEKKLVKK